MTYRMLRIFSRRMPVRLLPALAVLWGVICVGAFLLWIDSTSTRRTVAWFGATRRVDIHTVVGAIGFWTTTSQQRWWHGSWSWEATPVAPGPQRRFPGLKYWNQQQNGATHGHVVRVPFWLITGASLVLPALWLAGQIHHAQLRLQRTSEGRCVTCGYDLQASPEKCPECGTAV